MNSRILAIAAVLITFSASLAFGQASSAYIASGGGAAVDAKGVRYLGKNYPGKISPWMADRIRSISPDYPYRDRAQRHEGRGYFRLSLDLKTGSVTRVAVQQSTRFPTLDAAAVAALRQWRWRPGRWKQIETPVGFRLSRSDPRLPPGSVPLPLR